MIRMFLAALLGALLLAGTAQAQSGRTFIFAQEAAPPTLDPHFTTSTATRNISMNIFEMLVTRGENNQVVNQIADKVNVSADGLTYEFALRRGIVFHNKKPMTSADVLASFERYKRLGVNNTLAAVASMEAPDPHVFRLTLKAASPIFLEELSSFTVPIAILPAEEKDKAGGKVEIIGTGPFAFVEWKPDSHVELRRFAEYAADARFAGNDGFGGRKLVKFDTVRVRFVPEAGARVAALETGEVHAVEDIPTKAAVRLKGNKDVKLLPLKNHWQHAAWVNHVRAPSDNLKVRQAIQAALDMEEIMEIATDGAYTLQVGLQYPGTPYYSEAAKALYNVRNPGRAKQLLKEGGYKGEELVIITNSSYQSMYQAAVVVTERLRGIGMNVRMDVFDWSTAVSKLKEKEAWNLWFTGHGSAPAVGPSAAVRNMVSPSPYSFAPYPELDAQYKALLAGKTLEERKATFAKMQEFIYQQVLFLKFGDLDKVQGTRANVNGFVPYRAPRFWNVDVK
jgi:peptide/nickel transport system substrate-binding protein